MRTKQKNSIISEYSIRNDIEDAILLINNAKPIIKMDITSNGSNVFRPYDFKLIVGTTFDA